MSEPAGTVLAHLITFESAQSRAGVMSDIVPIRCATAAVDPINSDVCLALWEAETPIDGRGHFGLRLGQTDAEKLHALIGKALGVVTPRVLIEVQGGIANETHIGDVQVEIVDYDGDGTESDELPDADFLAAFDDKVRFRVAEAVGAAECSTEGCSGQDVQSTYCGSFCGDCLKEHC